MVKFANIRVHIAVRYTKEEIEKNLMQQATVMTVRGSVREEFIASMEMSRF